MFLKETEHKRKAFSFDYIKSREENFHSYENKADASPSQDSIISMAFTHLAFSSTRSTTSKSSNSQKEVQLDDDVFLNNNFYLTFESLVQSPHLYLIGDSDKNFLPQTLDFSNKNLGNCDCAFLGNEQNLCYFKQIKQINVDGFEWDLT